MATSEHPALLAAVVALCAVVPLAVVFIVALLRSYTIDLHMSRDTSWRRGLRRHRHRDED